MIILIIDLNKSKHKQNIEFDKGDILIFNCDEDYDYYQVVYDSYAGYYYLLNLSTYCICDKNTSLTDLIRRANDPDNNNNYKLIEVLKPNEVVLRRVASE